ncbi:hypothetical protein JIQ42_04919 [Leishmania sp. Namibia]|uniref:hypothetical protein n=1 Tax=Leishmania sp. Namibia TaxID=2802991 RepID=UPI001B57C491|nr:hypothetical protein JIQ42_04919 [Leishmania sp. Namibia]
MIRNGEGDLSGARPPNAAPSYKDLRERIQQNRELSRISSSARRRVGVPTPSDAEVKAAYTAREAAAERYREEMLQGDRHRRGVVPIRYYDTSMTASTNDVFQEAPPMSDVEARRAVLQPLKKLVSILAARQRFASLLRSASGAVKAVLLDQTSPQVALQSAFPASSPLPNISTLLRGITLPDVAELRRLAEPDRAELSYGFVDVPRSRPWHEPFAFRHKNFMPVPMPEFALDVAAQADKEVRRGDGECSSPQEANNVPRLIAAHPPAAATNPSLVTLFPTSMQLPKEATLERGPAGATPATG